MGPTQDLMHWNFSAHKCNLYSLLVRQLTIGTHCCTQTVTLSFALKGRTPRSHYSGRNQFSMTTRECVTHDCQMWSDFRYLHLWWRDATVNPLWMIWMFFTNDWLSENIKQAKENECSHYKRKVLLQFFPPVCLFSLSIFSQVTPSHVLHS